MKGDAQLMDFSSNSFLIFGVGGLLVRYTVKKKK